MDIVTNCITYWCRGTGMWREGAGKTSEDS